MTKLAPEWVRTNDPVIRSPARYRWATAPTADSTPIYESIENLDNSRIPVSDSLRDDTVIDTSIQNVSYPIKFICSYICSVLITYLYQCVYCLFIRCLLYICSVFLIYL